MTHSNRLPPHKYMISQCVICGSHWRRPLAKSWARKCPECFKWTRVSLGVQLAATAMKEGAC